MSEADSAYVSLVKDCLAGERIVTRNAPVMRAINKMYTFTSTPLVGVRRTAWRNSLREMEWFLSGSNHIDDLHPAVRHWWMPWVDGRGVVPFNYGAQFRTSHGTHGHIDQIQTLLDGVMDHPFSRRNVITTWNTADMNRPECPITNCWGTVIQASVGADGLLSLTTYQRSSDVIVGLGANWLQMAAFHLWLSARVGRRVGSLTWIGGDCHIYEQHLDLAREIVGRAGECPPTPILTYTPSSDEFLADDFSLDGEYRPVIDRKAEMVV